MFGIAYYLYFQLIGCVLLSLIFHREKTSFRLLFGSVAGSLLATWLPILFAFFADFTVTAHLLSLLVTLPLWGVVSIKIQHRDFWKTPSRPAGFFRKNAAFFCLFVCFMAFWGFLLHTHTILPGEDGGLYTGQCTYGDMNMHLGFITSLAGQHTFPPDYSILPGIRLSYPFLSDSISSSLLVLGSSLRTAYIFPMLFAMAQLLCTVYLFAKSLFASVSRGLLALLLFFCNGGFGFVFFLTGKGNYHFSDIFTGFYTTPTNLIGENIRWVNVVADMLLPQRATLFGYATLFPALLILYLAVFEARREYFPLAGLFVAALPMIHTHSFLGAGIISAAWLLLWLQNSLHDADEASNASAELTSFKKALLFFCTVSFLCLIQYLDRHSLLSPGILVGMGVSVFITFIIYGFFLLYRHLRRFGCGELLRTWGVYLACILIFALPQLLYWTFHQVAEGGFVRGHFNWGNLNDFYPWFYVKNLGIVLLPILGGLFRVHRHTPARRRARALYFPALLLWWLAEFIVFTPNTYDNNKLLYVAYFFLCLAAADFSISFYQKLRSRGGRSLFAAFFLFCGAFSGALTLGREAVSRYQLYSPAQTALAAYVEENVPADAVFLTDTRHNNEIAALTGRNVVCGADTFLYYHGLDTTARRAEVQLMYEAPTAYPELFEKYAVSYIVLSSFERHSYQVDEAAFQKQFEEVFSFGDAVLYRVVTNLE